MRRTAPADAGAIGWAGIARRTLHTLPLILLLAFNLIGSTSNLERLRDFGAFMASGRAAAAGLDPYGLYGADPNLNPPVSLLVFEPLSRLEPAAARQAWYAASLGCFIAALALLAAAYRPCARPSRILWVSAGAGLWFTLQMGQLYTALLLAATAAWLLLRHGRQVAAGFVIGALVAIKPQLGVWSLMLIAAGLAPSGLVSLATGAGLSLLPMLRYGPGIYVAWLRGTSLVSPSFAVNVSLPGIADRLGMPWLGLAAGTALALWLLWLVNRRRPGAEQASSLGLAASLLAAPVAWVGYTVLLVPLLMSRRWTRLLYAAAAILLVPAPLVWAAGARSPAWQAAAGLLYFTAVLLILVDTVRRVTVGDSTGTEAAGCIDGGSES